MTVTWFDGVTLTVEVGFASNPSVAIGSTTWSDITSYVRRISCKRGRDSELEQFRAGTLKLVLDNRDRRFDPNYSSSPYSPNVLPMSRIRLRAAYNAVTYDVWSGFVDDWPQEYDIGNTDATVTVSCTDGFKVLSLLKLPESVYAVTILADTPVGWWRLGEQSGTQVIDSSGNQKDGTYTGGATFNTRTGLVAASTDNGIGFDGVDDSAVLPPVVTDFPCSLEAWVSFATGSTNDPLMFEQRTFDGNTTIAMFADGASGAIGAQAQYLSPTSAISSNSSGTDFGDSKPHHAVATFADANTPPIIYVDGVSQSVTTVDLGNPVPFGHDVGYIGRGINPASAFFSGTVDEVAVYNSALSAGTVANHYAAGTDPWAGDTTGARVGRLLDLVAWPSADRTVATGISTLQFADLKFAPTLQALQSVEASEQGQLYMGADGTVVFRDRHWRFENTSAITSQATFGDSGVELKYSDIVTDGGEQFLANHIRASRAGGATADASDSTSIGKFYERLDEVTDLQNQSDLEVRDLANWRLATRKNPVQRVTVLEVKPRASSTTLFPQILGRDIGHRLTVKRRPQGVGSALTYTVLIEGIEHHITSDGEWITRFYLSSTDSQSGVQPLILDDAVFGLLDVNVLGF